jgi:hypothetical protein
MDPNRVRQILDRLPQLVVELDPDPVTRGPAHLQKAIFTTRSYLNETGVLIQEVLRYLGGLEGELDARETLFQIRSDELMAEDDRVTSRPSIRDREAMINVIEREARAEILRLRQRVREVQSIEKAVRHRHRELEHTMSAIRLQRGLIQTEVKTGSFYGDESNPENGTWSHKQPKKEPELDESSLEKIFNSTLEEDSPGDKESVLGANDLTILDRDRRRKGSFAERPVAEAPSQGEHRGSLIDFLDKVDLGDDVSLEDDPLPAPSENKKSTKKKESKSSLVQQDLGQFDSDATLGMGEDVLEEVSEKSLGDGKTFDTEEVDQDIVNFLDSDDDDDDVDLLNIFDEI